MSGEKEPAFVTACVFCQRVRCGKAWVDRVVGPSTRVSHGVCRACLPKFLRMLGLSDDGDSLNAGDGSARGRGSADVEGGDEE